MTRLPNGWPQPTFLNVTDGDLFIEWCFDDWRVSFSTSDEGNMTIYTTRTLQHSAEDGLAPDLLAKVLNAHVAAEAGK